MSDEKAKEVNEEVDERNGEPETPTVGFVPKESEGEIEEIAEGQEDREESLKDQPITPQKMTTFSKAEIAKMNRENEEELSHASGVASDIMGSSDKAVIRASRDELNSGFPATYISPIGESLEFESPIEKMKRVRSKYIRAAGSYSAGIGVILSGKVTAVRDMRVPVTNPETKNTEMVRMPVLEIFDSPVKVLIPISEFTRTVDSYGRSRRMRSNDIANQRLMSQVSFMVTHFDEAERIAYGTRLPVLDRQARRYFLNRTNGRYMTNEGDIIEARVTFITENKLGIEARGVETTIDATEVSWVRTSDLREYFYETRGEINMVGKTVPVKVISIDRKSDPLGVIFSVKRAVPDERAIDFTGISVGERCIGTVVSTDNGMTYARLEGYHLDCLLNFINFYEDNLPGVGRQVLIHITGKNIVKERNGDNKYNIRGNAYPI